MSGEPILVSLFADCGGSSLGYRWAGFRELLAVEWDGNVVETFRLNFPGVPVWKRDIRKIRGEEILGFCSLRKGELDLLDGSPPCQGYSTAGKRVVTDERNDLFRENIRLIGELQPKIFVIENVSGMIKGKMKGIFKEYMKSLKSLSYKVKCKLMNAKYYGVPQSRQRLIWIGVRNDLDMEPSYPEPYRNVITVGHAWTGVVNKTFCRRPTGNLVNLYYEKLKPGISYSSGPGFSTKRLSFYKPSNTLPKTIKNGLSLIMHPTECRSITIEEAKRLQTFPDDFMLFGEFEEQWAGIGNSVPPRMMEAIAGHIRDRILSSVCNN